MNREICIVCKKAMGNSLNKLNGESVHKHCQKSMLENYDKKSHAHCWTSKNPPCGKKAHARCCLCEEPAPHIMKELEGKIAEGEERIKEWQKVKIAPQEKEHRVPYQKPIAPTTNDWEEEILCAWNENRPDDIIRTVRTLLKSKAVEIREAIKELGGLTMIGEPDNLVLTEKQVMKIVESKLL